MSEYIQKMLDTHQNSFSRLAQIIPQEHLGELLRVWLYVGEESNAYELAVIIEGRIGEEALLKIAPAAIAKVLKVQRYSIEGLTYPEACAVDNMLREAGYTSNISTGAVAIYIKLSQIEAVNELLSPWKVRVYLGPSDLTSMAYLKHAAYREYLTSLSGEKEE